MSQKPLNAKHARFVAEFLVDLNATQAARRAGYSSKTAKAQGSRLLTNAAIAAAIAEGQKARAERTEVKADDILRELMRLAFGDIGPVFDEEGQLRPLHELAPEVRRTISSIEHTAMGSEEQPRFVSKVKFWDKTKALELLGKHLKLFTDKVEHSGAVSIAVVDPYATEKPRG